MKNLTINLDTYLLNWYCALPIEALNEIHFGDVDYTGIFGHDARIIKDELQDEWHNGFDLEDKVAYHDDLYDKYYEQTKHITL
jgi:hypothetical protein